MPKPKDLIYWDSSVFLGYINNEADRIEIIESVFKDIENSNGKLKIITSSVAKVEVAFCENEKKIQRLDKKIEQKIDALWEDDSVVEIIEFHGWISSIARQLIRESITHNKNLKPMDAIHLASAKWLQVKEFLTYDPKLEGYSDKLGFKICAPYCSPTQSKLFDP